MRARPALFTSSKVGMYPEALAWEREIENTIIPKANIRGFKISEDKHSARKGRKEAGEKEGGQGQCLNLGFYT
jgi:hypothetical protein